VRNTDALKLVRILRQHRADLNTADNAGNTPLLNVIYHAGHDFRVKVFKELVVCDGANPFIRTNQGISPLQVVAKFYDFELLKFVITCTGTIEFCKKADASILVAACCCKKERTIAVLYLLQAGADPHGIDLGLP
jgi:hypothetical protein